MGLAPRECKLLQSKTTRRLDLACHTATALRVVHTKSVLSVANSVNTQMPFFVDRLKRVYLSSGMSRCLLSMMKFMNHLSDFYKVGVNIMTVSSSSVTYFNFRTVGVKNMGGANL